MAEAPQFNTDEPFITNSQNGVIVFLPLRNAGSREAANVIVTAISFGVGRRISPARLPMVLGNLHRGQTVSIDSRFESSKLTAGRSYVHTIVGTYETDKATSRFSFNRNIILPKPSISPIAFLKAHVEVSVNRGVWTYTIFNDEPAGSQQFVAGFALDIFAPIRVSGTPPDWEVDTDYGSYILWTAIDKELPYPHHVAPGRSLGGFRIESSRSQSKSTPYIVNGWDHQTDQASLIYPDVVLSPSR